MGFLVLLPNDCTGQSSCKQQLIEKFKPIIKWVKIDGLK